MPAESKLKIITDEGYELRGDKIVVSCRKAPGNWSKERLSNNHHQFGNTLHMDARARLLKKYTNVTAKK